MINLRLIWFLESNNLLWNLQTVIRAKRSNIDQIVCIETLIREASKKEHLVAVLFDLEKAHDTSCPYGILRDLGLQGRLPIIIKHFLEDRTFQTRMKNTLFNPNPQEIGVPLGSILLFYSGLRLMKWQHAFSQKSMDHYADNFICYSSKNMATIERKIQQCIKKISKMDHGKWFQNL